MSKQASGSKPIRWLPGVVIVGVVWLTRLILPLVDATLAPYAMLVGMAGLVAVVIWWSVFSRATVLDKISTIVLMALALFVTRLLLHQSIREAGMGYMFFIVTAPYLSLMFVIWSVLTRNMSKTPRCSLKFAVIFLSCLAFTLFKMGGMMADGTYKLSWRWTPTAEDLMLADAGEKMAVVDGDVLAEAEAIWPAFRGPLRDGIVHGVKIKTNWNAAPPVEMWRQSVGPGWSSFSVQGSVFFTQEQRGDYEAVTCYRLEDGALVWKHEDKARFWEAVGGAGPRATPTLHEGKVYTLGATGILNCLDLKTGSVMWTEQAATEADAKIPIWAFSGSPLIMGNDVLVAVSSVLASYNKVTGEMNWKITSPGDGYSSPHLMNIDGVQQVLLQNSTGTFSIDAATGQELWRYAWKGVPIVQPAMTPDGHILVSADQNNGMRSLNVALSDTGWTVQDIWASKAVKPYFNDSVIHKGCIYGYGSSTLACIDMTTGALKWKGGRYGRGQILLLADQDLIIVISEKGRLALVKAVPDGFEELANIPALTGKTWNHPVLAGDILLLRNSEEMCAYKLTLAE